MESNGISPLSGSAAALGTVGCSANTMRLMRIAAGPTVCRVTGGNVYTNALRAASYGIRTSPWYGEGGPALYPSRMMSFSGGVSDASTTTVTSGLAGGCDGLQGTSTRSGTARIDRITSFGPAAGPLTLGVGDSTGLEATHVGDRGGDGAGSTCGCIAHPATPKAITDMLTNPARRRRDGVGIDTLEQRNRGNCCVGATRPLQRRRRRVQAVVGAPAQEHTAAPTCSAVRYANDGVRAANARVAATAADGWVAVWSSSGRVRGGVPGVHRSGWTTTVARGRRVRCHPGARAN